MSLVQRESEALFHTYERLTIGTVERAEGCYIYTDDGKRYLDLVAGLGVNALGHSHPRIVEAVQKQASKYLHLSNLYLQQPQVELAERLKALSGWDKIFWSNSGTEAVEGALKLARKFFNGERAGLVGFSNGFHGRTYGPLSVMDKEKYRKGYGPFLPGGMVIDATAEALRATLNENIAAIILEPVQGEGGINPIPIELVAILHELREKYGFLIIADEIQSGIGRTGAFFAYEELGLQPDIVVAAKAIGGGLPLGAILTSDRVAQAFSPGVHGTTFGGNALACAAGIVVLDELASGLMEHVRTEGMWIKDQLLGLKAEFPQVIHEVRGKGFMLGVQVFDAAVDIQRHLLEQGIIINVTNGDVLRLLPPLILTRQESEQLISCIRDSFRVILGPKTAHISQQVV